NPSEVSSDIDLPVVAAAREGRNLPRVRKYAKEVQFRRSDNEEMPITSVSTAQEVQQLQPLDKEREKKFDATKYAHMTEAEVREELVKAERERRRQRQEPEYLTSEEK